MWSRIGLFLLEKVLLFLASKLASDWADAQLEKIEAQKRSGKQKAAKAEMDVVFNNPESTAEERAKAYEKFINS